MVVSTPDRVAYVAFEAEFRRTYWREDARDSTFFRKEVAGDFSDLTIEWQDYLVEAYIDLINYRAYTKDAETDLDKKQGTPLLPGGPRPPYVYSNFGWNDKSAIAEYADAYREYSDACEGYLESLGDFIRLANEIPDFTYQRGPLIIGLAAEQRTVRSKWDAAWPIVEELEVAQDVGTPMEQLASLSKARQAALLNHRWVGQWELGAGAFGRATGWVKQNKDGIVSDRIVIKDAEVPNGMWEARSESLDKRNFWSHEPDGSIRPNEVAAMMNLRNCIGASRSIVKLRCWISRLLVSKPPSYRLYLEYCPHGDLFGSWAKWYQLAEVCNDHEARDNGDFVPPYVAEPFIWHLIECMATAGLLLEKGTLEEDQQAVTWEEILHFDMKASNVFLASACEDRYRGYPTPKLGDFGLCTFVGRDDKRAPGQIGICGTTFNRGPEQVSADLVNGRVPTAKANVYGAGIIAWSVMEGEEGDHRLEYDGKGKGPDAHDGDDMCLKQPRFRDHSRERYSRILRTLITSMTAYEPDSRPTFRAILDVVRDNTGRSSTPGLHDDLSQGLVNAPADAVDFSSDMNYARDRRPVGVALTRLDLPPELLQAPPPPDDDSSTDDDADGNFKLLASSGGSSSGRGGVSRPSASAARNARYTNGAASADGGALLDDDNDDEPITSASISGARGIRPAARRWSYDSDLIKFPPPEVKRDMPEPDDEDTQPEPRRASKKQRIH